MFLELSKVVCFLGVFSLIVIRPVSVFIVVVIPSLHKMRIHRGLACEYRILCTLRGGMVAPAIVFSLAVCVLDNSECDRPNYQENSIQQCGA